MEDGGGELIGLDKWGPIVIFGWILFFFGAIVQLIIDVVKSFTARNQGEENASEEPLTAVNKGKENTTKKHY